MTVTRTLLNNHNNVFNFMRIRIRVNASSSKRKRLLGHRITSVFAASVVVWTPPKNTKYKTSHITSPPHTHTQCHTCKQWLICKPCTHRPYHTHNADTEYSPRTLTGSSCSLDQPTCASSSYVLQSGNHVPGWCEGKSRLKKQWNLLDQK